MKHWMRSVIRPFLAVVVFIGIDQTTKWAAREILTTRQLTVGPIGLVLTMNTGIAFGLFSGRSWVVPVNTILGLAVAIAGVTAWNRGEHGVARGLLLMFSGFVGNFVDRLVFGQVTDFLWVRGWSVFNVADCLVTAGAILCGLALAFPRRWGFHA